LLKTIGEVKTGKGTSGFDGSGASSARAWLTAAGLNSGEFRQVDGSGLSRMDLISAASFVRLLDAMSRQRDFSLWYNALPIAGLDGTLRNRMKSTVAAGNCHAKTGSLSHVSALSGYVTDHDGKTILFSILMNNHLGPASACTHAQDRIVQLLAGYSDQPATTVGESAHE
jgi:D-alanyl-D-alanine carboxypeptidase/D-alanyl-D-alanine-endopeptidase (penicillin-binding protein 4)